MRDEYHDEARHCQEVVRQDIAVVEVEVAAPRITRAVQSFRVTDSQKIAFIGKQQIIKTGQIDVWLPFQVVRLGSSPAQTC